MTSEFLDFIGVMGYVYLLDVMASFIFRALIPYLSVGIIWCGLHSAWWALIAYHVAILLSRDRSYKLQFQLSRFGVLASLITLPSGVLAYYFLDSITKIPMQEWLVSYGLEGWKLWLMVPYFGLIHPVIEQIHWAPLRRVSPISHLLFAGYHLLVLFTLFHIGWLIMAFIALAVISYVWFILQEKTQSLGANTLLHIYADFGLILAVVLLVG